MAATATRQTEWKNVRGSSTVAGAVWRAGFKLERNLSMNNLHWAMYDAAGRRVAQGTDRLCIPTADELAVWDAEAPGIAARGSRYIDYGQLYIRWGKLPKAGRSRNHATGQREAGISVYWADYNPGADTIDYDDASTLAGAALTHMFNGTPCYLVTGDEVGIGSDGEPLIRNARIIASLTVTPDGLRVIPT